MTMWLKAGAELRKAIGNLVGLVLPSYTSPTQPAFLAYNSVTDTNQTGAGTLATVDFDTEIFDRAGNFATDTFTAPTTGLYRLSSQVAVSDLTAAMTNYAFNIVTSNRTYLYSAFEVPAAGDIRTLVMHALADMDSGDTSTVTVQIANGAGDTADILGQATLIRTFFCGELVS